MTRRAILIGNADYSASTDYPDLRCPPNDVAGLAAELRRKERGAFATVLSVVDKTSAEIKKQLFTFLSDAEPNDTVLVYFSGHGDLDSKLALHFCARDSQRDMLEVTAVASSFLWDLLDKCRATRKAVFLDCCYAGAAAGKVGKGTATTVLRSEADAHGSFLMTASDAISSAVEKEGDRYGLFTKFLIDGIASGEADVAGDGQITLGGLYAYVAKQSKAGSGPAPQHHSGGHGDIVIAASGRDSRKDRALDVRKRLYSLVAEGVLTHETALTAVAVAEKRPTDMTEAETQIDEFIDQWSDERLTIADFASRVNEAAKAPAQRPRQNAVPPNSVRPPDSGPPQKPSAAYFLNYGVPAVLMVAASFTASVTYGNGFIPGLIMVAGTGWNLNKNKVRLGFGGIAANAFIFGLGVLAMLAGLMA